MLKYLTLGMMLAGLGAAGAAQNAVAQSETAEDLEAEKLKRLSYYLGIYWASNALEEAEHSGADPASVLDGIRFELFNPGTLSDREMERRVQDFHSFVAVQERARSKAEQDETEMRNAAWLITVEGEADITKTRSGLLYRPVIGGTGARASKRATVWVNYRGELVDGTVFDEVNDVSEPTALPVTGGVPGFQEALTLMPVGAVYEVWLPAKLAYGRHPAGLIPANSVLKFTITLHSIEEPE